MYNAMNPYLRGNIPVKPMKMVGARDSKSPCDGEFTMSTEFTTCRGANENTNTLCNY